MQGSFEIVAANLAKITGFGLPLLVHAYAVAGAPATSYHLLKTIHVAAAPGGGEYFDYITFDPDARRVYASHGTAVNVFDADSGSVVGTIAGLIRCHGIAVVHELGKGFITDGDAGKVVSFDTASLKINAEVKADYDANAITYDTASRRIFSFNKASKNVTVIDPAKETVIATIPLGGAPDATATDGKGMMYVNLEDVNQVLAIDSVGLAIKARWPVAPAGQPTSMALDRQQGRLFIGGREPKILVVMNTENGKILQSFAIGDHVDTTTFDPQTGFTASSTREGTINIFREDSADKFSPVENVKTEYGAKTMALDPKTHNLWVDTSDFGAPQPPAKRPNPLPAAIPGTFRMLIYTR
ncbi:MAG: YncE family protein [Bryobacteraceae bacterium]